MRCVLMRRGAGPVGVLAAYCAFHRGASRVLIIDEVRDPQDVLMMA